MTVNNHIPFNVSINALATDFRAETVAAAILQATDELSSVIIKRKEPGQRPHTKDIVRLHHDISGYDFSTLFIIDTNREGIYDSLPENLFHNPSLGSFRVPEDEIIARIRQQRKEEDDARRFFAPFEQESTYVTIQAAMLEAALTNTASNSRLSAVFSGCWPLLRELSPQAAGMLLHILPVLHKVRADYSWISAYLSLFLDAPVRIAEVARYYAAMEGDPFMLGHARLEEDMILSGMVFNGETDIALHIGPLSEQQISSFTPGSALLQHLDRLCHMLFPMDKEITLQIITRTDTQAFRADDDTHAYLGLSTFI